MKKEKGCSTWTLGTALLSSSLFVVLLCAVVFGSTFLPQIAVLDMRIDSALPSSTSFFWPAITLFGGPVFLMIVGLVIVSVLLQQQRIREAGVFFSVVALGLLLDLGIKAFVARGRPDGSELAGAFYSFPSGHALMATVIYGAILLFFWKPRLRIAAAATTLFILLIGTSRVLLHRHYASDVIAGFLLGIAVLAGTVFCEKALRSLRTR